MTNKERMLQLFKEMKEADSLDKILDMMSDDIVWITEGPQGIIPFAGEWRGKKAMPAMFKVRAKVLKRESDEEFANAGKFDTPPQFIGADNDPTQVFFVPKERVFLADKDTSYTTGFAFMITFDDDTGLITRVHSLFNSYDSALAFSS